MKLETMVLGPLETNCYLLRDEQTMEAAVIDPGASGQKIADRLAKRYRFFHPMLEFIEVF